MSGDAWYDELSALNNELVNLQRDLSKKNAELEAALLRVRKLEGIIPICMHCKSIRGSTDTWSRLEEYLSRHTDAKFSHGLCPGCLEKHYPEQ